MGLSYALMLRTSDAAVGCLLTCFQLHADPHTRKSCFLDNHAEYLTKSLHPCCRPLIMVSSLFLAEIMMTGTRD